MHYRTLGQTGLQVSEVGLGAMPFGGMVTRPDGTQFGWSGTDDRELIALVHRSGELGVNLLDTAAAYGNGHGEAVVGEALQGRRDKWIIATKVNPNQGIDADTPDETAVRKRITEACEQSLHRLQTDHLDIYQLHAMPHPWAMPSAMRTLAELREAGKIRWYGISTNNREAIDQLRAYGPLHVLQIGYNMLERGADALLHWARAENIGTLIRVPLAKGMLTGKYSGPQAVAMPAPRHASKSTKISLPRLCQRSRRTSVPEPWPSPIRLARQTGAGKVERRSAGAQSPRHHAACKSCNISSTYPAGRAPGLALIFFSVSCAKSGRSSCGMSSSCTRVGMPMER